MSVDKFRGRPTFLCLVGKYRIEGISLSDVCVFHIAMLCASYKKLFNRAVANVRRQETGRAICVAQRYNGRNGNCVAIMSYYHELQNQPLETVGSLVSPVSVVLALVARGRAFIVSEFTES